MEDKNARASFLIPSNYTGKKCKADKDAKGHDDDSFVRALLRVRKCSDLR